MKEYGKKIFILWEYRSDDFENYDKEEGFWKTIPRLIGCLSTCSLYLIVLLVPSVVLWHFGHRYITEHNLVIWSYLLLITLVLSLPFLIGYLYVKISEFLYPCRESEEEWEKLGGKRNSSPPHKKNNFFLMETWIY